MTQSYASVYSTYGSQETGSCVLALNCSSSTSRILEGLTVNYLRGAKEFRLVIGPTKCLPRHNRILSQEEIQSVHAGIHPYHQQWPPTGAPPPPSAVSSAPPPHPPPVHHHHPPPPGLADRPPYDELRTIFIAGLPDDVKERELLNLLRWLPGYEASQVNFKGEKPMGIVGDSNAYDQSKRLRTGGGDCTHSVYSPSPFHPPPPQVWGPPHGYLSPAAPPYDPYGGYHAPPVPMPPSAPIAAPSSYVPVQIHCGLL
ncbi:unnamed protein product [Brassica rapa subsp. trilocularis]